MAVILRTKMKYSIFMKPYRPVLDGLLDLLTFFLECKQKARFCHPTIISENENKSMNLVVDHAKKRLHTLIFH